MTTFLGSYERPRRQPLGETSRIGRLVRLSEDTLSAVVDLGNEQFELPVSPGKYVLGANVAVLESKGKPRRVSGPAGVWPDGLDEDADAPVPVTAMVPLGPRELTPEESQAIQDTADGLADAQADLQDAFERIGNLATEVGFAWSGHSEEVDAYPPGTNFRVDWTALGGGEFRLEMKNIPTGVNFGWNIVPPGESNIFIPDVNPVVVTATEPGSMWVYAWADNENISADFYFEVHPAMLDAAGPLQAAIAEASHAAVRASRIAPRSRREPTIEDGDNRPVGSVWTKVNAEGEELAYWAWDGTEWVPQALGVQVIPYLDAAHIKTGVLDADRINVTEIWGKIATFENIITQRLLAPGSVTTPALNIVPPEGEGGLELLPPGLRIIPDSEEGGTAVSLRTDEPNWLAFAQNGMATFSVSPSGHLVAQQIDANESLQYMGVELSTVLDQKRDGILARARMVGESLVLGTSEGRVVFATFRVPSTPRSLRVVFNGRATADSARHLEINLRSREANNVQPESISRRIWAVDLRRPESINLEDTFTMDEWGLTPGATATIGIFVKSISSTDTVRFVADHGQLLTIEDAGPAVAAQTVNGWAPPTGGSGGGSGGSGDTKTREYTEIFTPSWHQSYLSTGGQNLNGASRMYHGNPGGTGVLTSMIGFSTAVQTFIGSGTVTKVEVWLRNSHTFSPNGMTARIGWHRAGSKRSSYEYAWTYASTYGAQTSFNPGQGKWITMPLGVRNDLTGSEPLRGIVLDPRMNGTQYYGHFNGPATMLRITVEK